MRRSFLLCFKLQDLLIAIAVFVAPLLNGCQPLRSPAAARIDYDITQGWQAAAPADQGVSNDALAALGQAVENEYPVINSVLIVKNGYIVFEKYRPGSDEHTYHELYSVTKSVTSLLVGIAIDQGLIESAAQPIAPLFGDSDPSVWRGVTVEQLLTMSAGFDNGETFGNMNYCLASADDWRGCLADVVRAAPESGQFLYTESGAHLLSIILTEKSGQSELEFANANLFGPLGIKPLYWDVDSRGHNWGSSTLSLIPRDMAKLGLLVLNGGRWGERQIVAADWIVQATQKHSDGGFPLGVEYGYLWWLPTMADYPAVAAFGSGGQFIVVFPQLNAVVVITADVNNANPYLLSMIEEYVMPALANNHQRIASP